MGQYEDAVATLSAEIEHQPDVVEEALASAASAIEAAAEWIRRDGDAPLPSFGIGDSDLVGRLAAACEAPGAGRLRPIASIAAAEAPRGGRVALGHSIGGSTQATLAACARWQVGGGMVVGITGERESALARRADLPVVLEIPRFPPDAKVPGTVTVTVPLAAVWALLDSAGAVPVAETAGWAAGALRAAREAAGRRVVVDALPRILPGSVHVVVERELGAAGAYAEAKLAEAVGVTAARADPESWLHVQKHAVQPDTLVLALPFDESPSPLFHAVARETALRGGVFLSSCTLPTGEDGAPLALALVQRRSLPREALLRALCFVQLVALHLLVNAPDRAPYQLGRLTRDEVRGLEPRTYAPAPLPQG